MAMQCLQTDANDLRAKTAGSLIKTGIDTVHSVDVVVADYCPGNEPGELSRKLAQ